MHAWSVPISLTFKMAEQANSYSHSSCNDAPAKLLLHKLASLWLHKHVYKPLYLSNTSDNLTNNHHKQLLMMQSLPVMRQALLRSILTEVLEGALKHQIISQALFSIST